MEEQEHVVATTKENYITSISALNIYSDEGTGDWHFSACFIPNDGVIPKQILAGIDLPSTNEWLKDYGIFDAYSTLKNAGVKNISPRIIYAADHYRAIADMIYHSIKNDWNIIMTISLNDWLPMDHEKQKVYALLDKLKPAFTVDEWLIVEDWKRHTLPPD